MSDRGPTFTAVSEANLSYKTKTFAARAQLLPELIPVATRLYRTHVEIQRVPSDDCVRMLDEEWSDSALAVLVRHCLVCGVQGRWPMDAIMSIAGDDMHEAAVEELLTDSLRDLAERASD